MRIIAGEARGRVLKSLKGELLQPTADRVRESLFGMLSEHLVGARFLDLFAGTGAVGLEALSRGANQATFVESHSPAGRVIQENIQKCGFEKRARVLLTPVARALAILQREHAVFDLIFLDPPYDRGEVAATLSRLTDWPELLEERGYLIIQRSRHEPRGESAAFTEVRTARYGETIVDILRRVPGGTGTTAQGGE
jgi:16S rRNA (guanine966-N2)-methyltransferase